VKSATPHQVLSLAPHLIAQQSILILERICPTGLHLKLLLESSAHARSFFIGAGAASVVGAVAGLNVSSAVAFGHGLAIMAFAFAMLVSGGHMNPAVTVRRTCRRRDGHQRGDWYSSEAHGGRRRCALLRTFRRSPATGIGMPALAHTGFGRTTLTITAEPVMIEA